MARIVHLLHSFPPDSRGGIEQHVEALAGEQLARGHRVAVVAGSDGAAEPVSERRGGLEVLRLPREGEWERAAGRAGNLALLERWLAAEPRDLLHVHHFAATGPGAVELAARLGMRTFVTLHDLFALCPLYFRLRDEREPCAPDVDHTRCVPCLAQASGARAADLTAPFQRRTEQYGRALAAATALLAPSASLVEYLDQVPLLAGRRVRCVGFPRGAAPRAAGHWRERAARSPLAVATWGGLVRGKGLDLLVLAAGHLEPGAVEVHHHGGLLDPAYARVCQDLAAELRVPLHLHGSFEPGQLETRLAGVDLAVHPSRFRETYGLTTDEAHGLGLPVLVSDRGAPKERLGTRGAVFRADDHMDLARVLRGFWEEPERLVQLARGAPPDLLTLEHYADRLDRLLVELTEP